MSEEIIPNTQTPPATGETQADKQTEAPQEPISVPESIPESQTAQISPTEPLASEPDPIATPEVTQNSGEAIAEPEKEEVEISEPKPETHTEPNTNSAKAESSVAPVVIPPQNKVRELLTKARNAIQTRKRKKLEKIMTMFAKQTNITNDEVEKLLHVSDATATRYLTILKKENKIKQSGKTGKGVSYSKI